MTFLTAAVFFVVTVLGVSVQSVAGMGFGMVAVPIYTILLGPAEGVLLGNITGLVTTGLLAWTKRRNVEWNTVGYFFLGAVPGVLLTSWLLTFLATDWLNLLVGSVMVAMVIFSFTAPRLPAISDGVGPKLVTGLAAAALSVTVAQSGPAMTSYAQARRWNQLAFAATLQPFFLFVNMLVIPSKLYVGLGSAQALPPLLIGLVVVAIVAGMFTGGLAAKIISPRMGRNLALFVATVGATAIVIRSLWQIFA